MVLYEALRLQKACNCHFVVISPQDLGGKVPIELCSICGNPLPLIFAMGVLDKTCGFV
jgi:hypothetical protein